MISKTICYLLSNTNLATHPFDQVEQGFRRGYDVEGGRHRASLLKIRDPQLTPSKLPFRVGFLLIKKKYIHKKSGKFNLENLGTL